MSLNDEITLEMKDEALRRLKDLELRFDLGPKLYNYFKEGKLYYSYGYSMDTINYDPNYAEAVKEFERYYKKLVYHVIEAQTQYGPMLSFLYVSDDKEEWNEERLVRNYIESYSFIVEGGWQRGEFGDIWLDTPMGYLSRIK